MTNFFSIIIPTLNEEKYLPRLLNDLKKQQANDFEVIIVDGKSADKTITEAEKYSSDLLMKVINSPKRNLSFQRNYGAKHANGKYLVFFDADMRIGGLFLFRLKKIIQQKPRLLYLPFHKPERPEPKYKIMHDLIVFFTEISQITDKPFTYGPCMVFERHFFNFLGGYDESIFVYEDHEIVQRAKRMGVQAKLLPNLRVRFSLRRYQTEGTFNVLRKYFIASVHLLLKGKINQKIFDYEMGGQISSQTGRQQIGRNTLVESFQKLKKIFYE